MHILPSTSYKSRPLKCPHAHPHSEHKHPSNLAWPILDLWSADLPTYISLCVVILNVIRPVFKMAELVGNCAVITNLVDDPMHDKFSLWQIWIPCYEKTSAKIFSSTKLFKLVLAFRYYSTSQYLLLGSWTNYCVGQLHSARQYVFKFEKDPIHISGTSLYISYSKFGPSHQSFSKLATICILKCKFN